MAINLRNGNGPDVLSMTDAPSPLQRLRQQWGQGTQEIVSLCVRAGHPEPEFGEQAGSVWVRFLPSGYIAPHRIAHDFTARQREILHVLGHSGRLTFADVRDRLAEPPSDRSIRNDLMHLRQLGLARLVGRGRGAKWSLIEVTGE